MLMVKVQNGTVDRYPYTPADLRADYPQTSFPSDLSLADLSEFGVYPVALINPPSVDYTQVVEELQPDIINGVWTQRWRVRPTTPAEQDAAMKEIIAKFTNAIQKHLDAEAKTKNYDGILSACSYASGSHPRYSVEGQACLEWRGNVWDKGYEILSDVKAGLRPMPTIQQIISELPPMVWPV